MRTTARISLCALALLAAGIAGCRDDDRLSYEKDAQEGDVPPIGVQSISVLKSLYHDRTIRITQEISIQGHIVANDTAGEFYKEIVVEDDTGGIVWRLIAPGAAPAAAPPKVETTHMPPQRELTSDPELQYRIKFKQDEKVQQ